jgi:hypothetical protein
MRQPMLGAWTAAALVALCACAQSASETAESGTPAAASAQGYGAPTSAVGQTPQQGYSTEARRLADCAASFPNYDYRTDSYQPSPGVIHRCPL